MVAGMYAAFIQEQEDVALPNGYKASFHCK
jgi:hypothetical protein